MLIVKYFYLLFNFKAYEKFNVEMSRILKFIKTVKTNWKKSVIILTAVTYGTHLINTEYRKNLLVREYCRKAVRHGNLPLQVFESPRHVTVILNPAANKRKAVKEYEKFCAPLLHLAGISVTLLVTNKDTDAINMTTKIPKNADAVVIAGGDGTVSEVVTGLLRLRNDNENYKLLPVGILPLGKTNSLANRLYSSARRFDELFRYRILMEATYSIVNEVTKPLDVMEIRNIDLVRNVENPEKIFRPIYAVDSIQLGAFRDAHMKIDKYWYFWKLRSIVPYVLGSFYRNKVIGELTYTSPCTGCAKCYKNRSDLFTGIQQHIEPRRWWHAFVPNFQKSLGDTSKFVNYEKIENLQCDVESTVLVNTVDLNIATKITTGVPSLRVDIGPNKISYLNFIKEGWLRENSDPSVHQQRETHQTLNVQKLRFMPSEKSMDNFLSIDNEEYEVKKIAVTLLHNIIAVFQFPSPGDDEKQTFSQVATQ